MYAGNVLERGELAHPRVQLSKRKGVFQMVKFLEFRGKFGCHQDVYQPEVFGRVVVTVEHLGSGDEIGVTINGAFGNQRRIIVVNVECFPLELTEVIPESLPGLDTVECAKEDNPK